MLVLLPPSETKRDGGDSAVTLDLDRLRYPELRAERVAALAALARLSRSVSASSAALGLSAQQRFEIDRNRTVRSSPLMPAIDRFTGVLYEGLDAASLDATAREWLARSVVVHSPLFGLVGADDAIPAYRLSHNSKLPGLALRTHWREPVSAAIAAHVGLVLDLRSDGYAALGPAPVRHHSHVVRVVTEGADGTRRALNHFNKKGKGEFVRALASAAPDLGSVDELLEWASASGIRLEAPSGTPSGTTTAGTTGAGRVEPGDELFLIV